MDKHLQDCSGDKAGSSWSSNQSVGDITLVSTSLAICVVGACNCASGSVTTGPGGPHHSHCQSARSQPMWPEAYIISRLSCPCVGDMCADRMGIGFIPGVAMPCCCDAAHSGNTQRPAERIDAATAPWPQPGVCRDWQLLSDSLIAGHGPKIPSDRDLPVPPGASQYH